MRRRHRRIRYRGGPYTLPEAAECDLVHTAEDLYPVRGASWSTQRSAGQQRGWSKALVRHGADARVALADVLGVPAKDISSRDLRE